MTKKFKKGGWYNESYRHSLASKGIRTSRRRKSVDKGVYYVYKSQDDFYPKSIVVSKTKPKGKYVEKLDEEDTSYFWDEYESGEDDTELALDLKKGTKLIWR